METWITTTTTIVWRALNLILECTSISLTREDRIFWEEPFLLTALSKKKWDTSPNPSWIFRSYLFNCSLSRGNLHFIRPDSYHEPRLHYLVLTTSNFDVTVWIVSVVWHFNRWETVLIIHNHSRPKLFWLISALWIKECVRAMCGLLLWSDFINPLHSAEWSLS